MDGEEQQSPAPEEKGGGVGPLIGIIIIVVVLVVGGFYYWGESLNEKPADEMTAEEILEQEDAAADALGEQGASDEIGAIEEDLDATDLESLDQELSDIESELEL